MKLLLSFTLSFFAVLNLACAQSASSEKSHASAKKIEWMSIEEAEQAAQQEARPVLIDVYTDWCGWCKRMDAKTFQHPGIAAYVNENYYAVKLDGEERDSIQFRGDKFGYVARGRRGYHELPAQLLNGKLSYPTVVFLNKNLEVIQPVPGFQGPQDFEKIITYLAEKHYQDQPFDQYKKNYNLRLTSN